MTVGVRNVHSAADHATDVQHASAAPSQQQIILRDEPLRLLTDFGMFDLRIAGNELQILVSGLYDWTVAAPMGGQRLPDLDPRAFAIRFDTSIEPRGPQLPMTEVEASLFMAREALIDVVNGIRSGKAAQAQAIAEEAICHIDGDAN